MIFHFLAEIETLIINSGLSFKLRVIDDFLCSWDFIGSLSDLLSNRGFIVIWILEFRLLWLISENLVIKIDLLKLVFCSCEFLWIRELRVPSE